jgi:uncharacterized membrane protein
LIDVRSGKDDAMNRTSMRLWAGLFVLMVFSAGLAAGFVVRPWIDPDPPRGGRGEARPLARTERLLDRLDANVDLSDDQRRRLREVFEAGRLRFREINAGVREQFEAERTQMNTEIANILTAEQMQVYENEIVRMGRERRGRFDRDRRRRFGSPGADGEPRPRGDRPDRPPR